MTYEKLQTELDRLDVAFNAAMMQLETIMVSDPDALIVATSELSRRIAGEVLELHQKFFSSASPVPAGFRSSTEVRELRADHREQLRVYRAVRQDGAGHK